MKELTRFLIAKVIPLIFIDCSLIITQHEFRVQFFVIFNCLLTIEVLIFYLVGILSKYLKEKNNDNN